MYYTFRMVTEFPFMRIEVTKWDEHDSHPLEVYEVLPEGRPGRGMCSCPAYVVCKHTKAVQEARKDEKIKELWNWIWDEKSGWQRTKDIQYV